MIELDPRLPKQMNGPVINAFMQTLGEKLVPADEIAAYLYSLSIDTAQEKDLENIGMLVGYPRPLMPAGFSDENTLILGTLPLSIDSSVGLADYLTMLGGELVGAEQLISEYMSLPTYRRVLKYIAMIKANGLTLEVIDKIASLVNEDYTIGWNSSKDVTIHFTEQIGFARVWVLSQLFYRVATSPQVIITAG